MRIFIRPISVARMTHFAGECFLFNLHLKRMKFGKKRWKFKTYLISEAATGGILQKTVLKHFIIFTGKHLCQSLFLRKLQASKPATLLQRDSNTSVFLWFCKLFNKAYFKKQLPTAASMIWNMAYEFFKILSF